MSRLSITLVLIGLLGIFAAVLATKIDINEEKPFPLPEIDQSIPDDENFLLGTGIYDITGPATDTGMMGYATPPQRTEGIHFRLYARAFIFQKPGTDPKSRLVFVSTDSCMIFLEIKEAVVRKLKATYGDLYGYENVILCGTHTHAGPGGYAYYAIYDITTLGFFRDSFDALVNGIVQAIFAAHDSIEQSTGGRIFYNAGELATPMTNINRSPSAYLNNPADERKNYQHDVDKIMSLLRLQDSTGKDIGMINWFPVHGTSMSEQNKLISGDNKGWASYLFERSMNGNNTLSGRGPFVGAFAQTNCGDVSPNVMGAFCPDGNPCEFYHSTCNGRVETCHGKGPGNNEFESTQIIATNQFNMAKTLFNSASTPLKGGIDYRFMFVNMSDVTVSAQFTSTKKEEHTCIGALGDAFAGGTTDGPGTLDFKQGANTTNGYDNPFLNLITSVLNKPTKEQKLCQAPKSILFNSGDIDVLAPWTANIMPVTLARIGQLFIAAVPGELTTMAGRRLKNTILDTLKQNGAADNNSIVVIAGFANGYSHYITTFEEYAMQRYEGGSTLYGPHTFSAYQQLFSQLAVSLAKGQPVAFGPLPPDISNKTFRFEPGVIEDSVPKGEKFGSIVTDVLTTYQPGSNANATFWGADLRNNLMLGKTFSAVEQLQQDGSWKVIADDATPETKFRWKRVGGITSFHSSVTVEWDIPQNQVAGTYRLKTYGHHKNILGIITAFEGTSSTFKVLSPSQ